MKTRGLESLAAFAARGLSYGQAGLLLLSDAILVAGTALTTGGAPGGSRAPRGHRS
jgi:hypothetical protein